MRWILIAPLFIAACSNEANHIGNPLLLPISGLSTAIDNAAYSQRRGKVEVIVKSNFDTIKKEIRAGGGPTLTEAMNAARIPISDRPARILQLNADMGLYENAPGPLVTALMVYGG